MMAIREATTQDADQIAVVHVAAWQSSYPGQIPQHFLDNLSVERYQAMWSSLLSCTENKTFVSERDGRIVGFCNVGASRDPDADAKTAELYSIYLEAGHQSSGTGSALWLAAYSYICSKRFSDVTLWVLTSNDKAQRFYKKHGFKRESVEKELEIEGHRLLEIRYRLTCGLYG